MLFRSNNPIEAVAQWRGGKLKPLCVFDAKPMPYDEPIADEVRGILDGHVVNTGYGRIFLRALPEGVPVETLRKARHEAEESPAVE